MPGAYPPDFILSRGIILARDLSIFVDESGDRGGKARYHLLTLVIHNQADSISDIVAHYEEFPSGSIYRTYRFIPSLC